MPIFVIDKIKQKNNGEFSLIDAQDVEIIVDTKTYNLKDYLANNVAKLENGTIPIEQIPTLVNDIINGHLETNTLFIDVLGNRWEVGTPNIDEKIFFDTDTKKRYLWSGVQFVELSSGGVELGTTANTAWYGNRGLATETKANANEEAITQLNVAVQGNIERLNNLDNDKQDTLTPTQVSNINNVPNKVDKTSIATINNKTITNGGNVTIDTGDKVVINSGKQANNTAQAIEVNGVNYKIISGIGYKEIVSDELLGTWVFKDAPSLDYKTYNLSFSSNGVLFSSISSNIEGSGPFKKYNLKYDNVIVYTYDIAEGTEVWNNQTHKTIEITDTSKLTNREEFTTWLKANATKQ